MPNARQLNALAAALCAIRNGETSSETLRDLAQAFGATHPKAGTLRAIQAVLDQIENPSDFTRDQDAYEKHGATKATFCRWKQKLTQQSRSIAVDELAQSLDDGDGDEDHDELSVALQRRDARLERHEWRREAAEPDLAQAPLTFLVGAPPDLAGRAPSAVVDAAEAAGISVAEAFEKLIISAADRHAAAVLEADLADSTVALKEREAREAALAAEAAEAIAILRRHDSRKADELLNEARAAAVLATEKAEAAAREAAAEAAEATARRSAGSSSDASQSSSDASLRAQEAALTPMLPCADDGSKVCRICLSGDEDEPLVQPCGCRGTAALVHESCLSEWRRTSSNGTAAYRCGQCHDDYRDALSIELLEERLLRQRTTLGNRHSGTIDTIVELGKVLHVLGKFRAAEPLHREAVSASRATLGDRHPDTLRSINNLASLLQAQGNLAAAEPLCREALSAGRATLGDRHPNNTLHRKSRGAAQRQGQARRRRAAVPRGA